MWACGAAGSALPWHGRGRRFDPDQVHHYSQQLAHWSKKRDALTIRWFSRSTCRSLFHTNSAKDPIARLRLGSVPHDCPRQCLVYTFMVVEMFAWRISSCTTLTSSSFGAIRLADHRLIVAFSSLLPCSYLLEHAI